ncbi:hypothetical protein D3C71_1648590 [compost metagenome]
MVDAQRIKAHQMGLGTDQIAVAAGDVDQRPKARLLLHERTERHIAHARYGQRVVRQRQRIGTSAAQRISARHKLRDIEIPRRIKLDNDRMAFLDEIDKRWLLSSVPVMLGQALLNTDIDRAPLFTLRQRLR